MFFAVLELFFGAASVASIFDGRAANFVLSAINVRSAQELRVEGGRDAFDKKKTRFLRSASDQLSEERLSSRTRRFSRGWGRSCLTISLAATLTATLTATWATTLTLTLSSGSWATTIHCKTQTDTVFDDESAISDCIDGRTTLLSSCNIATRVRAWFVLVLLALPDHHLDSFVFFETTLGKGWHVLHGFTHQRTRQSLGRIAVSSATAPLSAALSTALSAAATASLSASVVPPSHVGCGACLLTSLALSFQLVLLFSHVVDVVEKCHNLLIFLTDFWVHHNRWFILFTHRRSLKSREEKSDSAEEEKEISGDRS